MSQLHHDHVPTPSATVAPAQLATKCKSRDIKQTTGIQNLDGPAYLGQEVEVPNYRAQKAIAAGLDNMLDSLGAYFAGVDRQLACMQERRQALITAAVTGQIDVTTARGADV